MANSEYIAPGIDPAPDIETSSDAYASRFRGKNGRYLLGVQEAGVKSLLESRPAIRSVIDVGGGHAQLAGPLIEAGYSVTVAGSDTRCADRLRAKERAPGEIEFVAGRLIALPLEDMAFDAAISVRLISHIDDWQALVGELCRLARHAVVIDYPTYSSLNALSLLAFPLKRFVEKNTRTYRTFFDGAIDRAFARHGFRRGATFRQFALPMALHRAAPGARSIEEGGRKLGVTRLIGNPVLARFDRGDA